MSSFISRAFQLLQNESPLINISPSPPRLFRYSDSGFSEIQPRKSISKFSPLRISRPIQKPKKRVEPIKIGCKCMKSKCEKSYCECFATGKPCGPGCLCLTCNNVNQRYIKKPQQGCNCRKTGCQKRYCECYLRKQKCTYFCNCLFCENCDDDDNDDDCSYESQKENANTFIGCLSGNMLQNEAIVRQLNQKF